MANRPPERMDAAEKVWAELQAFVAANSRTGAIQETLGLGLGAGRVRVLLRLRQGPMTLGELAATHGVDAPYATIIVNKLEELGLVQRTAHPDDRRRKLVTLTAAGWEATSTAEAITRRPPAALQALSAAELSQLDGLLARLGAPPAGQPGQA
jgi:DNA-binding MarR family transcriptional regulator